MRKLLDIQIRDARALSRHITALTGLCVALALSIDIVVQLVFFESWTMAVRSWAVAVLATAFIVLPVIAVLLRANLTLYRASRTDPLTGLFNRLALFEGFGRSLAPHALVIIDVDRFKLVNDTHGHLVGDEVLRTVASLLEGSLGQFGLLGRLGGEEFALLAAHGTYAELRAGLDAFRQTMADTAIMIGTAAIHVTISAGLARRSDGQSFEHLYALADGALYAAKAAGRNRVMEDGQCVAPFSFLQHTSEFMARNVERNAA